MDYIGVNPQLIVILVGEERVPRISVDTLGVIGKLNAQAVVPRALFERYIESVEAVSLSGGLVDHSILEVERAEIRKALRLDAGGDQTGKLTRQDIRVRPIPSWNF